MASIALNKFVNKKSRSFDFQKLFEVSKVATINLNKIIDYNYYPIPEAKKSNLRHRPIGLGIQGLADAFIMLRYPFESPEAKGQTLCFLFFSSSIFLSFFFFFFVLSRSPSSLILLLF